jgi:L-lactate dehydrogenase complex protein LldG
MTTGELNPVLESIRRNLGRDARSQLPPRPPIVPPRQIASIETELDLLVSEINKLSGNAKRISCDAIDEQLVELVHTQEIKKVFLWETAWLAELRLMDRLQSMGVEIIPNQSDRMALAQCDLGITEVDFALPETGTLGLLSSPEKPRLVSLLPRVHLAFVHPGALSPDLHEIFAQAKQENYLILITGPSRTSDIELTVTLGVHGPKFLYVWVCDS